MPGLVARFASRDGMRAAVIETMTLAFLFVVPLVTGYLTVRSVAAPSRCRPVIRRYHMLAPSSIS